MADDADDMFLFSSNEDEETVVLETEIKSEQDIWDLLAELAGTDGPADVRITISDMSWARLNVVYYGEPFHQSLTADSMKGLVDFQTSFYQTVALLIKGSRKASVLTDEEKKAFELVFNVGEGRSDVEAKGDDKLTEILKRAVDKMEPKHIAAGACLAIALYFGQGGLQMYLNHSAEIKRIEEQGHSEKGLQDIIRDMNQTTKEQLKIISELARNSDTAKDIITGSIDAHESIVRHTNGANGVKINGTNITAKAIGELKSTPRRTGTQEVFEGVYVIEAVDTTDPKQFQIKLRNLSDGIVFTAKLADAVRMEEYKGVIQEAEWKRSKVLLKVSARKVGDTFKNAEILSAQKLAAAN